MIVGLFFGESLVSLLNRFPSSLLGIMVIAAGLELASVGESLNTTSARDLAVKSPGIIGDAEQTISPVLSDYERKKRWAVMMVTIGLLVGFKNDAIGFAAGMLCHWSYQFPYLFTNLRERFTQGRLRV
jgi:hypothetical protein